LGTELKFLLDTNIISYAFRNQGQCRLRIQAVPDSQICISSISYFELTYGLALMPRPQALEQYCQSLKQRYGCMDLDLASAELAGQLRAQLRLVGTPIGEYDLLIAGIALANKLTLVTHNTSEFSRVPGLQLEDWYA
jgi:tRNA(fMet)-specific endonuclease VapC